MLIICRDALQLVERAELPDVAGEGAGEAYDRLTNLDAAPVVAEADNF